MNYRLTDHALEETNRRGIAAEVVERVMFSPEQIITTYSNRKAYQSRTEINGKLYLVRVIAEENDPASIMTVYRTSKIEKYWSADDESNL